jgi:Flp pilus assembly protein TadD
VSLDRGKASYTNNLGACLLDSGRNEEAEFQFRKAVRFEPHLLSARVNLGRVRLILGDTSGAMKALRRAHELAPDEAETFYLLGVAAPDPKLAKDYFKRYVMMDPEGRWAAEARRHVSVD